MMTKSKVKTAVDVLMTLLLMLVMGYQFWGEKAHEYLGAAMFMLFILHHLLNGRWHKNLFKGRYSAVRTITLIVDILVLITMLIQMTSGIIISKYAFSFAGITGGMAIARKLHIIGAYWGYVLMSVHIGLHFNMIAAIIRSGREENRQTSKIALSAGILSAAYGVVAFIKRDFPGNMLMRNEFVFLDYGEAKVLFYLDYIAVMWLFVMLAYVVTRLVLDKSKNKG